MGRGGRSVKEASRQSSGVSLRTLTKELYIPEVNVDTASGATNWQMPAQIFLGSPPSKKKFKKASLNPNKPKPSHGLWTSSLKESFENEKFASAWCELEDRIYGPSEGSSKKIWNLEINPGTKVFSIQKYDDIEWLKEKYPLSKKTIEENTFNMFKELLPKETADFMASVDFYSIPLVDYDVFSKDYQGLHVSSEAIRESRGFYTGDDFERKRDWLNFWDVESTVWFDWVFGEAKELR